MLLRSAYASRTKRELRGRGPSHRDQNPFGRGPGGEGGEAARLRSLHRTGILSARGKRGSGEEDGGGEIDSLAEDVA